MLRRYHIEDLDDPRLFPAIRYWWKHGDFEWREELDPEFTRKVVEKLSAELAIK